MNIKFLEAECLFFIDGMFLTKELSTKSEYDETTPDGLNKASQFNVNWFKELPNILIGPQNASTDLFGGRLLIYKDSQYFCIKVDGIEIIADSNSYDDRQIYRYYSLSECIPTLNDIATYGVDDFLGNYRNNLQAVIEEKAKLLELEDDQGEVARLKKKLISLRNKLIILIFWRAIGKTNDEMNEISNKLDVLIANYRK